MKKAIYFDMDGTIANLYAVDNWLEMLRAYDATPYKQAKTMLNMNTFARLLNRLQKQGYYIGIVSWLSRESTEEYDKQVTNEKIAWLDKHLHSVNFDEISIVANGTPKAQAVKRKGGILFDDELNNRKSWDGIAYDEKNILQILKMLAKNA